MGTATQTSHPWRTTLRTVVQALIGLAVTWPVIVQALGLDETWVWVSVSLTVAAGITRVMAVPQVEAWLQRFLPWLAAQPSVAPLPPGNYTMASTSGNYAIASTYKITPPVVSSEGVQPTPPGPTT